MMDGRRDGRIATMVIMQKEEQKTRLPYYHLPPSQPGTGMEEKREMGNVGRWMAEAEASHSLASKTSYADQ